MSTGTVQCCRQRRTARPPSIFGRQTSSALTRPSHGFAHWLGQQNSHPSNGDANLAHIVECVLLRMVAGRGPQCLECSGTCCTKDKGKHPSHVHAAHDTMTRASYRPQLPDYLSLLSAGNNMRHVRMPPIRTPTQRPTIQSLCAVA
jgi:hypothetical protein